jgi:hypothetical protein
MQSDPETEIVSSSKCLVAAALLFASGWSHGMFLDPDGTGQVLLFSHYNAREGNDTLISVVNTTDEVKALRVRFMEGVNSREVLAFNLYLGPWDSWVAAVSNNSSEGGTRLVTLDPSCTVPSVGPAELGGIGEVMFTSEFFTGEFSDIGIQESERAASGHLEVIEMGVVVDELQDSATAATPVYSHGGFGEIRPTDCEQLTEA